MTAVHSRRKVVHHTTGGAPGDPDPNELVETGFTKVMTKALGALKAQD